MFEYKKDIRNKDDNINLKKKKKSTHEKELLENDEDLNFDEDGMQESIYKKRNQYSEYDMIQFYEGVRFTLPFIVYRHIHWWRIMDVIAKYANIFISGCYVYVCFYMKVNLFNCFNIFLLISFFFMVTIKVGRKAERIQKISGV